MRFLLIFATQLLFGISVFGQPKNFKYTDYSYSDQIRTVQLKLSDKPISLPIIPLRSSNKLILSFDDLAGGFSDFAYRIIHCTKNWEPTDLLDIEYIDGFNDELIENYLDSKTSYVDYTHYMLELPNEDLAWTKSGNYLLLVYDIETNDPILTRRFVVYEDKVDVWYKFVKPQDVSQINYQHSIEIKVENENFPIGRPNTEVFLSVLQNGVWSNSIQDVQPKFSNGNFIHFTDFSRINFPALKEFRFFDCRTFDYAGLNTHSLDINDDGVLILLDLELNRKDRLYDFTNDSNGQYFIDRYNDIRTMGLKKNLENSLTDLFNYGNRTVSQSVYYSSEFQRGRSDFINYNNTEIPNNFSMDIAEYADVIFTLDPKYQKDQDVYILGAFNEYQPYDEFKMEYDEERELYIGSALFKQGYYNYLYGVFEDGEIDFFKYEGSSFKTENNYTALVYYRPLGTQYDRVIGYSSFNSNAL